ncbi:MAG: hypothetical protein PHS66_00915 [Candidatus Omnitrophica bacterium]|nr:hypothetical protein [Candidatus Omnitrophota bacterium]
MPGNEKEIAKYLVAQKGAVSLQHLGVINSVGAPDLSQRKYTEINTIREADNYLSVNDPSKKADIYVNGHGVSLKQSGSSFSFNRLQRANMLEVFSLLGFSNPAALLQRLDTEVTEFHEGNLERRNRPWQDFFNEDNFKALVRFLMVQGSPNVGFSSHQAEFILEAPLHNISVDNIEVFTFEEYFSKYINNLKIAIRRVWYGQASDSEHSRAKGLIKKAENAPWVFNNVSGIPDMNDFGERWRQDVSSCERKTIYFLMIEKEGKNSS